jgi:hypothetical protein
MRCTFSRVDDESIPCIVCSDIHFEMEMLQYFKNKMEGPALTSRELRQLDQNMLRVIQACGMYVFMLQSHCTMPMHACYKKQRAD